MQNVRQPDQVIRETLITDEENDPIIKRVMIESYETEAEARRKRALLKEKEQKDNNLRKKEEEFRIINQQIEENRRLRIIQARKEIQEEEIHNNRIRKMERQNKTKEIRLWIDGISIHAGKEMKKKLQTIHDSIKEYIENGKNIKSEYLEYCKSNGMNSNYLIDFEDIEYDDDDEDESSTYEYNSDDGL